MPRDTFSENIGAVSDLIESNTNKIAHGFDGGEGSVGDKLDILDLPMTDKELLKLRDDWEKAYAPYEGKVAKPIAQRNLRSYLGRTKDNVIPSDDEIVAANLQFESEETFLPAATAQDPSPYVYADNTPEGNAISDTVQTMLQFHAQQLLIRRKLAVMVRQWSIYQLGVLKPGWDDKINDVAIANRKIQDFIFDPNGYVDVYGDFSSWLGERITVTAEKLIELFPKHENYITLEVKGFLGTEVTYTEWWNDDYCFTTFKLKVLDKHKNEYFNYEEEAQIDEITGMEMPVQQKRNHFAVPKKPYIFLSIFSLQERPHDITGLIEQNIPNQNLISRRTIQIDDNLSQSNNGIAFSENNFNQETAKQASNALTRGVGKVLVPPGGPISEAIVRIAAPNLPSDHFNSLEVSKNDLRSSWGTQGIFSQEAEPNETAKGQMIAQNRDTSRIGGGIIDILEQSVAKGCFDWLVQLYHVFYDQKHFGAIMGSGKATEYVELSAKEIDRQLIVGVSPNSMKPKDQITEINMAKDLFTMKAIGPKTLLEALDFPNPEEAAGDGTLYAIDPMSYFQMNFPELAQKVQQFQQQQMQAQQQALQQQQQMEQQAGEQQIQQKAQQGQMQLQQSEQAHGQQIAHKEQDHQMKLRQGEEMAKAKVEQAKITPKVTPKSK